MKYDELIEIVKTLPFDEEKTIIEESGTRLFIFRPSQLSKRFESYDRSKNFQIWLTEGERKFRPNHLRVMIDLNLRARSRPDLKKDLFLIFDNIFYGDDPNEEIKRITNEKFEHFLNPLKIIANLSQLFIAEQNYSYAGESKFDPPTLFYQGWVRQAIDNVKEIDNICMSIANRQPPTAKYVSIENKKNSKFREGLGALWYLDD
ncbi:MAG TPA: hypothetical protein VMW04_01935 [Patescibacteria group bacterium]|nr:hypothetical protein [Patescibacteria group bacterium]